MKILIVSPTIIPVLLYGGIGRVIWSLGKELDKMGHTVSYLVPKGSFCPFGKIIPIDPQRSLSEQIPQNIDIVHFNTIPDDLEEVKKTYIITIHTNINDQRKLDKNSVFVSQNHSERYGASSFVHNGLDWDEYSKPDFVKERKYFHFLGNAAWRLKNVKGAIRSIKNTPKEQLQVLGGVRFNIKMGLRFTFSRRIHFSGFVGGAEKDVLLNGSKGLVFPVMWHEPFGLAITESLYFGCPIFGTPYGSLPELVNNEVGFLSNKQAELTDALLNAEAYDRKKCHEYARDMFNSKEMALGYLKKYEQVLSGKHLNLSHPRLLNPPKSKFLDWIV